MSEHPYRPLFVEEKPVKIRYTFTHDELKEALKDYIARHLGTELYNDKGILRLRTGNNLYTQDANHSAEMPNYVQVEFEETNE